MAVYCHNCGHENPAGVNFCSSCGVALPLETSDATVTLRPAYDPGETQDDDNELTHIVLPHGIDALVVKRGSNPGARYDLVAETTRAGRHPESDIFLDDITVSRRHAELFRTDDGRMRIRDVGSLNGTYVNRERIEDVLLRSGDEVQIGKFKLIYLTAGEE
jgi:pSer/pThr/pTyr-binding forkhead associated (FHA) protein